MGSSDGALYEWRDPHDVNAGSFANQGLIFQGLIFTDYPARPVGNDRERKPEHVSWRSGLLSTCRKAPCRALTMIMAKLEALCENGMAILPRFRRK
jgi:hypothetical protein